MKTTLYLLSPIVLFFAFTLSGHAQKLPNKQETSIWAPANIKIDGKTTEWDNTFQANNHATDILYTIANDDKNLYLVAYLTETNSIFFKAMTGGITLVIQNGQQNVSIRYPVLPRKPLPLFTRLPNAEIPNSTDDNPVIVKNNALLIDKAKEIEVIGVKGIDTLISVYNEYDIKVAGRFGAKQGYVYELAIPLKYLGLAEGAKFNYQILLNSGPNKYSRNASEYPTVNSATNADGTAASQAEVEAIHTRAIATLQARYAGTDFSGEYTLAKKP